MKLLVEAEVLSVFALDGEGFLFDFGLGFDLGLLLLGFGLLLDLRRTSMALAF